MNILILTRIIKNNSNSIYNSYSNGIFNNYPETTTIVDYFDLYFENSKKGFEENILKIIQEKRIDLIFINFVSGDLTFDIYFLEKLSSLSYLMMNFYDSELFFEPIDRYYAQCADLVLLPTSSDFIYNFSLLDINAISTLSLFDTKLYKNNNIKKDIDISFVGDLSKKSRKNFINYLKENGYKVQTYGTNTENGRVDFDKMVNIFNRSKINLNFSETIEHRSFDKLSNIDYSIIPNIVKYMKQLKGRSIEIALCGSFTLTQDAIGIDELFNPKEIDTFDSKETLLKKVTYYLKNTLQREAMAEKSHLSAINRFDATKQFQKILNSLDLNNRKTKKIYMDESFLINYNTYHTLYLFNFLFKFKFKYFKEEFKIIQFKKIHFSTLKQHFAQQFKYQITNKYFRKNR